MKLVKQNLSQAGILANISYYSALVAKAQQELEQQMKNLQAELAKLERTR
jgi:hypothetical protein